MCKKKENKQSREDNPYYFKLNKISKQTYSMLQLNITKILLFYDVDYSRAASYRLLYLDTWLSLTFVQFTKLYTACKTDLKHFLTDRKMWDKVTALQIPSEVQVVLLVCFES